MSRSVWGYQVLRSKGSPDVWPPELKREAVPSMLEDDHLCCALVSSLAAELDEGALSKFIRAQYAAQCCP